MKHLPYLSLLRVNSLYVCHFVYTFILIRMSLRLRTIAFTSHSMQSVLVVPALLSLVLSYLPSSHPP